MKTQKVILSFLCLLILFGCSSLNAAEKKEFSNTRHASALIRIQADPSFVRIGDDASLQAIFRPAILQAVSAVYSGIDTKDEEMGDNLAFIQLLEYSEGPGPEDVVQVSIDVDLDFFNEGIPMAAEEIKEQTLDRLRNSLDNAFSQFRESRRLQEEAFARQVTKVKNEMEESQRTIFEISGGREISHGFLEDQITGLSKELQDAEFAIRINQNHLEHMRNQLDQAEAVKAGKPDPITDELRKKIELLEQNLQNMQKTAVPEIQEIQQRLIEARIELAERQEMVNESPEAHRVRELKEQLTQLSLERSEQEMRIQFLNEQLAEARDLLGRSTDYETLRIKADVQRDALHDSIEQLEEIRRENRLITQPIITVISQ